MCVAVLPNMSTVKYTTRFDSQWRGGAKVVSSGELRCEGPSEGKKERRRKEGRLSLRERVIRKKKEKKKEQEGEYTVYCSRSCSISVLLKLAVSVGSPSIPKRLKRLGLL